MFLSPASLLSLSFVASLVTAQTWHIPFVPVSASLNSTDDYLLPLRLGANRQTVYLNPSLVQKDTTIFSPSTCTPPGSSSPNFQCAIYRGQLFDPTTSTSYVKGGRDSKWKQAQYGLFANGVYGNDKVEINAHKDLERFEFILADSCNMTSGLLGLGRDSTFLNRLKGENVISSRSFGLHVGVDIMNHPDPVADPSFDDGRDTFLEESEEYTPGLGRRALGRREDDPEEIERKKVPKRDVHHFPGSITFGGYDKAKISGSTLTAPIAEDGTLKLKIKKMLFRNALPDTPKDFLEGQEMEAIIDTDTPHFYMPEGITRWMGKLMGSTFGEPGIDFYHSYIYWDTRLGAVNFTLEATSNGKTEEIMISVPPTVFYQPIGILKDFVPRGIDGEDFYSPFRSFGDNEKRPIVLGRSFLKAAYLYINHDTRQFQLSQVAYTNSTPDLITLDAKSGDIATAPKTNLGNPAGNGAEEKKFPVAAAAGGAAGALVVIAIIAFVCVRRKRKQKQSAANSLPLGMKSNSPVPGGRMELHADPHPGVPLQTLGANGEKVSVTTALGGVAELDSTGVYAPGSDQKAVMADSVMIAEMPASSTPTLVNSHGPYSPPPSNHGAPTPVMSPVSAMSSTPSPNPSQMHLGFAPPPPSISPFNGPANPQGQGQGGYLQTGYNHNGQPSPNGSQYFPQSPQQQYPPSPGHQQYPPSPGQPPYPSPQSPYSPQQAYPQQYSPSHPPYPSPQPQQQQGSWGQQQYGQQQQYVPSPPQQQGQFNGYVPPPPPGPPPSQQQQQGHGREWGGYEMQG
ncbi:acid protease [Ascobolus immersus RN42]|uniref:Acid protease n=1 Tax=Ascobolus immersus RN42 TaxID=1160509 RepID=A0A3N4HFH2_ASCIM|nr:acid protease [Ascobolus immersus RN42]